MPNSPHLPPQPLSLLDTCGVFYQSKQKKIHSETPRVLNQRVTCPATKMQYYPQSTVPDMVKMAEKEIPGVVMDHKKEWRQQKRDLDEGTKRGEVFQ